MESTETVTVVPKIVKIYTRKKRFVEYLVSSLLASLERQRKE
jgi:hypothetical protein